MLIVIEMVFFLISFCNELYGLFRENSVLMLIHASAILLLLPSHEETWHRP
jgi:hypothetical protein